MVGMVLKHKESATSSDDTRLRLGDTFEYLDFTTENISGIIHIRIVNNRTCQCVFKTHHTFEFRPPVVFASFQTLNFFH